MLRILSHVGQLDAIHSPVVELKSGGYIVMNQTEALVAIDKAPITVEARAELVELAHYVSWRHV